MLGNSSILDLDFLHMLRLATLLTRGIWLLFLGGFAGVESIFDFPPNLVCIIVLVLSIFEVGLSLQTGVIHLELLNFIISFELDDGDEV